MKKLIFILFLLTSCSVIQASEESCSKNADCIPGKYCNFEKNCGEDLSSGVCKEKPQKCNRIYLPVCGCNNKTYSNECVAAMEGVDIKSKGKC